MKHDLFMGWMDLLIEKSWIALSTTSRQFDAFYLELWYFFFSGGLNWAFKSVVAGERPRQSLLGIYWPTLHSQKRKPAITRRATLASGEARTISLQTAGTTWREDDGTFEGTTAKPRFSCECFDTVSRILRLINHPGSLLLISWTWKYYGKLIRERLCQVVSFFVPLTINNNRISNKLPNNSISHADTLVHYNGARYPL